MLRQSSFTHTNSSTQSEGHRWIQAFSFPMNHFQLPLCYALETYDKCTVLGPSWCTSSLSSSQSTDHQSKYSPLVRAPLPTHPLSPLWLGTASASLLSLTQKLNADHQRQRSSVNISPAGLRGGETVYVGVLYHHHNPCLLEWGSEGALQDGWKHRT